MRSGKTLHILIICCGTCFGSIIFFTTRGKPVFSEQNQGKRSDLLIGNKNHKNIENSNSALSNYSILRSVMRGESNVSHERQLAAIDEIFRDGSPPSIGILVSFLTFLPGGNFKDEIVRRSFLISSRESIPPLLAFLISSQDEGVIRMAVDVLARLADTDSLQAVVDAYDNSADEIVRDRLSQSVGAITNEVVVPGLIRIFSDTNTSLADGMASASTKALRQIGTAPAVDALLARINADPSDEARARIAIEVRQITNPLAEASLLTAAIGNSKEANTPEARIAAIRALINLPSAETRDELKFLQNDSDEQISAAATEAFNIIEAKFSPN